MASEMKPFLSDDEPQALEDSYHTERPYPKRMKYALLIHFIIVTSYTVIFVLMVQKQRVEPSTSLHRETSSPHVRISLISIVGVAITNLSITYLPWAYTDFEESQFAGPPSPSVDKAWHNLLENTTLRVSEQELERSNQTSVALPVGGGFMAWLGVYHQLHCIVRQVVYCCRW